MFAYLSGKGGYPRIINVFAWAILSALAILAVATFRDYGMGWDDYTHAEYGNLLFSLYTSGFHDTRALSFVNLYMYGSGFDLLAAILAKILPFDLFDTRRLLGAAIGIVGIFVTWRLAERLGGKLAGLMALILLATCPLFYGHMYINPKDAPFAVAMVVLLLGIVRVFQGYPRPRVGSIAVLGVGMGLAVGTRVIGVIGGLYALAGLVLIIVTEWRQSGRHHAMSRLGAFLVRMLPAFALGYLVMGLIWPWGVIAPLNPIRAIEYFSHFFEKPWKEMFDGTLVPVPEMPRHYVPWLFALEMPELLLVLSLVGIAGAFVKSTHRDVNVRDRAALLVVAVAATLPIAITVVTRPAMYNGIRHFVFVTPPLAVLGGLAGSWAIERARQWGRPVLGTAVAAMLAASTLPVVEMIRLHPYQYTHFNVLAGGIQAADERYMLDYWGLAFKQAAQELRHRLANEKPPANRPWRVAVCGPQWSATVELGPNFVTSWDSKGADFALMLGEFYCADLNAPVVVEIEREDVVYARVYDIRGQSVSSLLTIPPP